MGSGSSITGSSFALEDFKSNSEEEMDKYIVGSPLVGFAVVEGAGATEGEESSSPPSVVSDDSGVS